MRFRDFYNSIEELPKCHTVIEREVEKMRENAVMYWILHDKMIDTLRDIIHEDLKKKYMVLKNERLSILTIVKNRPDNAFCRELELGLEKNHKDEAEIKLKLPYMKDFLQQTEQPISKEQPLDNLTDLPIFYLDLTSREKNFSVANKVMTDIKVNSPSSEIQENIDSGLDDKKIEENIEEMIMESDDIKVKDTPKACVEGSQKVKKELNILVHGLQGKQDDMTMIMLYLDEYMPDSITFGSRSNESYHDSEIYLMGRRFAEEMLDQFKALSEIFEIIRMNFIGFSTGRQNII